MANTRVLFILRICLGKYAKFFPLVYDSASYRRNGVFLFEIRSTKSETRNNVELPKCKFSKQKYRFIQCGCFKFWKFEFCVCFELRYSDFEFVLFNISIAIIRSCQLYILLYCAVVLIGSKELYLSLGFRNMGPIKSSPVSESSAHMELKLI